MRQTPILSSLELSLLGLVREEPRSGYALRKALDASPGSIYPALRRLTTAGLIERRSGGRTELFHITTAGRRALRESLENPSLDEVRRDPQAVAARLRFLDGAAAIEFLTEYSRLSAQCAGELKQQRDLASEHDAALYLARARWAAAAAKRLRSRGA